MYFRSENQVRSHFHSLRRRNARKDASPDAELDAASKPHGSETSPAKRSQNKRSAKTKSPASKAPASVPPESTRLSRTQEPAVQLVPVSPSSSAASRAPSADSSSQPSTIIQLGNDSSGIQSGGGNVSGTKAARAGVTNAYRRSPQLHNRASDESERATAPLSTPISCGADDSFEKVRIHSIHNKGVRFCCPRCMCD